MCWSVGDDLRKLGDVNGRDAAAEGIEWLRKGDYVIERMEQTNASTPGIKELKVSITPLHYLRAPLWLDCPITKPG